MLLLLFAAAAVEDALVVIPAIVVAEVTVAAEAVVVKIILFMEKPAVATIIKSTKRDRQMNKKNILCISNCQMFVYILYWVFQVYPTQKSSSCKYRLSL